MCLAGQLNQQFPDVAGLEARENTAKMAVPPRNQQRLNTYVYLQAFTYNPTAKWTAQQITEAFPYDTTPKYMIRNRDKIYGKIFTKRIKAV